MLINSMIQPQSNGVINDPGITPKPFSGCLALAAELFVHHRYFKNSV